MEIEFFKLDNGEVPVEEFIESLDVKMRAKILQYIQLLKEYGNNLRYPYSAPIKDGIFELRMQAEGNITRILYFFYVGDTAVLTNGFVKKVRKTPHKEIEKALNYRKIYLSRKEKK